jgi:hypothetical protein
MCGWMIQYMGFKKLIYRGGGDGGGGGGGNRKN